MFRFLFPKRWLYPTLGMTGSLVLHATIIGGVIAYGIATSKTPTPGDTTLVINGKSLNTTDTVYLRVQPLTLTPTEETPESRAIDTDKILAQLSDPRWEKLVEPATPIDNAGEFVTDEINRIANAASQKSTEENLNQLSELTERLNKGSSEKSVDDINSQLRKVFASPERATKPAEEPVAGPFDFNTSQMHDVERIEDGKGGYTYTILMLDAAGRTMKTPIDAVNGENLYRTHQYIKKNPLLEKVYRGTVMSILDKVLKNPQ